MKREPTIVEQYTLFRFCGFLLLIAGVLSILNGNAGLALTEMSVGAFSLMLYHALRGEHQQRLRAERAEALAEELKTELAEVRNAVVASYQSGPPVSTDNYTPSGSPTERGA